ncbi:MAG: AAA domain-containing protein [Phycisphaerales bacterium]|nr:AAA domain-containing protein [Phycisphaerales bacterium]
MSTTNYLQQLINLEKEQTSTVVKYLSMYKIFQRACNDLVINEPTYFADFFSKLSFLCSKKKLDMKTIVAIHSFRIRANSLRAKKNKQDIAAPAISSNQYFHDLTTVATTLSHFFQTSIPKELTNLIPKIDVLPVIVHQRKNAIDFNRIRVIVEVINEDENIVYGFAKDLITEGLLSIKVNQESNKAFARTVKQLTRGCQINLIDVRVDGEGHYIPDMIILEPDYLIDISSLSECIKPYGANELHFFLKKFQSIGNKTPLLLGNLANCFLDAWVHADQIKPNYGQAMKEAFQTDAFKFSSCSELNAPDTQASIKFNEAAKTQFENIRRVVTEDFPRINIKRDQAILEPSFICESLGIQGRLDFLQLASNKDEKTIVIELKSGKGAFNNPERIANNHEAQMFLYQIVLQRILGIAFKNIEVYCLYSKYPAKNLNNVKPYMELIKEILNMRNMIVALEQSIVVNPHATKQIIDNIKLESFITEKNNNHPLLSYLADDIAPFKKTLSSDPCALEYFHTFYAFITKEHYLAKLGEVGYDKHSGFSTLWNHSFAEKKENGTILYNLSIVKNNILQQDSSPTIIFAIPATNDHTAQGFGNFREGDIVIVYEQTAIDRKNDVDDNKIGTVNSRIIFKGIIESWEAEKITIRFRYKQRAKNLFPTSSLYAIEHDFMDTSYQTAYRGLYLFLQANKDRRMLLLNQRAPVQDQTIPPVDTADNLEQIIHHATVAKDYYLLIGPPGTGKTSIALKRMIETFICKKQNPILLMAYTNRAVDEMCRMLENIEYKTSYIRIGSELSCEKQYRKYLLDEIIKTCSTRAEVNSKIDHCNIIIATISSLNGKMELFQRKEFQVAIIDEASQILEPHIIGLLSAKTATGTNAIQKFILIGDHKQLPAVVLQKETDTVVSTKLLKDIGLINLRHSLFERLYQIHKHHANRYVWGMLQKQGRMHPEIAQFPNRVFYNNQLYSADQEHQKQAYLEFKEFDSNDPFERLIATKRSVFIPSNNTPNIHPFAYNNKTNIHETIIVVTLINTIYKLHKKNKIPFLPNQTIGVITPYRNQIALIKKAIHQLKIEELSNITVDTVERFQGSQRDIIIYSFTVNEEYQVNNLPDLIEDNNQTIDRKLNVALTRARKQLFVTGNPQLLKTNHIFNDFILFIQSRSGYMDAPITGDYLGSITK